MTTNDPKIRLFCPPNNCLLKFSIFSLTSTLQPTQICYAVRGLTESVEFFQRKKIVLADEIYSLLQKSEFLTKMSEHPLDVVRVNSWKLIKIVAKQKLASLKDDEESKTKLRDEILAIVNNGFATRSETIWLTHLMEPTVLSSGVKFYRKSPKLSVSTDFFGFRCPFRPNHIHFLLKISRNRLFEPK